MLTTDSPKIIALLAAWHDNERACGFYKEHPEQADLYHAKHAHEGSRYLRLNTGSSGHFMVDRKTEMVYSIKGAGVPNLKKPRGTVEFLTQFITFCTTKGVYYQQAFWYDLHEINLVCDKCGRGAFSDHPEAHVCNGTAIYSLKRYEARSAEAALIQMRAIACLKAA